MRKNYNLKLLVHVFVDFISELDKSSIFQNEYQILVLFGCVKNYVYKLHGEENLIDSQIKSMPTFEITNESKFL